MLKGLLAGLLRRGSPRDGADAAVPEIEQAVKLLQLHEDAGAAELCERIVAREPRMVKAWELLGVAALNLGDYPLAVERFERVLALVGDDAQALANAAEANRRADRCERALELIGRALELQPGSAPFLHIRVLALESAWRSEEALSACREALRLHPDFAALHTSYTTLLNRAGADPALIRDAHIRWAECYAAADSIAAKHGGSSEPERCLRIGYVSADFRRHAMSDFFLPLLEHHDPARVEVYCYSNTPVSDRITRRCEELAPHWRDITALPDAAAADLVRQDDIDILVDLSGHTSGNRLGLFARKPAPVQITYLGYPGTTGLAQMDYRITDALADRPGLSEPYYREQLLRLRHSVWCFAPPLEMPEVGPLPASVTGRISFGSLNSAFKLTPDLVALWSRLLAALPESKLILAGVPAGTPRARISREFETNGVDVERLEFHGFLPWEEFWDLHQRIDIALDSFPSNGGATSCETLWMGVPLVNLAGTAFLSRAGLSILTTAGLPELVAHSPEEYLRIAEDLALDRARLAQLRAGLRERMRASPLLAAAAFTRDLEDCYRRAWRQWCERGAGGSSTAPADTETAARMPRLQLCLTRAAEHAAAGEHAAAVERYRESLQLQAQDSRIWCNYGAELGAIGQAKEAESACRRALELDPALAQAWYNLGRLLQEQARAAESESCYRAAAALLDAGADRALWLLLHSNWGLLLYQQGRPREAVALYRKALAEHADAADLHSNLLLTMQYAEGRTQAQSFAEHLAYARRFETPLKEHWLPHRNSRELGRRLRVAYVSPDFRAHSVAFFIEPVLAHHDPAQIEVYAYCNHRAPDEVTLRLKSLVRHWREISALGDDEAAQLIREDGIDILVDLAGHTAGGRLRIFARKPAPVQVTWLGYPDTTGLSAMDYRISDAHADPVGVSEAYYAETLWRLPDTFDCYAPPRDAPEVCALPAIAQGGITFGSFNNLAKLSAEVRAIWARVLLAVPGSRLCLKATALADTANRQRLIDDFAKQGVGAERLLLAPADATHFAHLNRYNQIDIALDPFPYNGVTTSFEAMWMGVPVVSLAGNRFISRMGVTMLANLRMTELLADTPESYVAVAAGLAGDLGRLAALRAGLRQRMANSPLTDAKRFTLNLEKAYRQMWTSWCARSREEAR